MEPYLTIINGRNILATNNPINTMYKYVSNATFDCEIVIEKRHRIAIT